MSSKIDGKFFNVTFTEISESKFIGSDNIENIRTFPDPQRGGLPFRFREGKSSKKQGGFFDEDLAKEEAHLKMVKLSDSNGKFNYVGIRFDRFKLMVNQMMSASASSDTAYQQMSASFFKINGFGNTLANNDFITLLEEDSSEGTILPRFNFRSPASASENNQSSGIVNASGFIDITIDNSSSFAKAATWSFAPGGSDHILKQTGFTSSFNHRFFNTQSIFQGIALSGSESGSIRGNGALRFTDGVNSANGDYVQFRVKGKIIGDGGFDAGEENEGDFNDQSKVVFIPTREILVFRNNTIIRSGSFKYNSSSKTAASSSGIVTTLYYQSGSNGPSGSHTGSGLLSGSHIFLDNTFITPASSGFYAVPGTNDVLHAFRGGLTNDITGSAVSGGLEHQVPRFVSRSVGPF